MSEAQVPPRESVIVKPEPHELAFDGSRADELASRFHALSDPQRLKILHLLMTRSEMCVCELMEVLGLTQSNVSFHINVLKQARFIRGRKAGKWIFYSLDREAVLQFSDECRRIFGIGR